MSDLTALLAKMQQDATLLQQGGALEAEAMDDDAPLVRQLRREKDQAVVFAREAEEQCANAGDRAAALQVTLTKQEAATTKALRVVDGYSKSLDAATAALATKTEEHDALVAAHTSAGDDHKQAVAQLEEKLRAAEADAAALRAADEAACTTVALAPQHDDALTLVEARLAVSSHSVEELLAERCDLLREIERLSAESIMRRTTADIRHAEALAERDTAIADVQRAARSASMDAAGRSEELRLLRLTHAKLQERATRLASERNEANGKASLAQREADLARPLMAKKVVLVHRAMQTTAEIALVQRQREVRDAEATSAAMEDAAMTSRAAADVDRRRADDAETAQEELQRLLEAVRAELTEAGAALADERNKPAPPTDVAPPETDETNAELMECHLALSTATTEAANLREQLAAQRHVSAVSVTDADALRRELEEQRASHATLVSEAALLRDENPGLKRSAADAGRDAALAQQLADESHVKVSDAKGVIDRMRRDEQLMRLIVADADLAADHSRVGALALYEEHHAALLELFELRVAAAKDTAVLGEVWLAFPADHRRTGGGMLDVVAAVASLSRACAAAVASTDEAEATLTPMLAALSDEALRVAVDGVAEEAEAACAVDLLRRMATVVKSNAMDTARSAAALSQVQQSFHTVERELRHAHRTIDELHDSQAIFEASTRPRMLQLLVSVMRELKPVAGALSVMRHDGAVDDETARAAAGAVRNSRHAIDWLLMNCFTDAERSDCPVPQPSESRASISRISNDSNA
jgi:hypothetical protein